MADRDARANRRRADFAGNVNHRAVLDIGARADADRCHIAANHATEPDIGIGTNMHIADHHRAGRDERIWVDGGEDALIRQNYCAGMRLHISFVIADLIRNPAILEKMDAESSSA